MASKYDDIKRELIDNELINIDMDEYLNQYNKTLTYMKTKRMKLISEMSADEEITIHHILALSIYCSCDRYQMIWSELFSRISADEDIESLKIRHLIELVERFGTRSKN